MYSIHEKKSSGSSFPLQQSVITSFCGYPSPSGFSQTQKIDIIANFVSTYICSFLFYFQQMVLVNMKLDISRCNSITFQGCGLHLPELSFLMAKLKHSWQYWHSCTVEEFVETLCQ